MNAVKSIFKSKTFWFNVLTIAAAIGGGQFGIKIDPKVAVPLVAGANVGLRMLTSQPVSLTGRPS